MSFKTYRQMGALLVAGLLFASATVSGPAQARGPRVFVGVNFGVPFAPYPYYYRPYYAPFYYEPYYYPPQYYPPVVVTPPAPPVYIEQGAQQQPAPVRQAAPQQEPASWWYYCVEAQGYYPYVKQCPGGWQQVSPQPPG